MKSMSFKYKALIANVLAWSLFIAISLSASFIDSSRAGIPVDVTARVFGYLISFVPWMIATPIFYWYLSRQHRLKSNSLTITISKLILWWVPLVLLFETWSFLVMKPQPDKSFFNIFLSVPLFFWVYCLILFSVIIGACLSLLYFRRYNANRIAAIQAQQENTQLALQLSELRIKSLLSQLEPHFLFNALNSIASLVRISDPKRALSAIKQLSDLLRYAVEASQSKFVSLNSELAFVTDYLTLQGLRYAEKLDWNIIDERDNKNQEVPPFLIQILVENAIKHSLEKRGEVMQLTVNLSNTLDQLAINIKNTQIIKSESTHHQGIGLSNLNDRLQILYQGQFQVKVTNCDNYYNTLILLPADPPELEVENGKT
jgi:two-component system, LytTR family, sensor histidine kinase AlgZ